MTQNQIYSILSDKEKIETRTKRGWQIVLVPKYLLENETWVTRVLIVSMLIQNVSHSKQDQALIMRVLIPRRNYCPSINSLLTTRPKCGWVFKVPFHKNLIRHQFISISQLWGPNHQSNHTKMISTISQDTSRQTCQFQNLNLSLQSSLHNHLLNQKCFTTSHKLLCQCSHRNKSWHLKLTPCLMSISPGRRVLRKSQRADENQWKRDQLFCRKLIRKKFRNYKLNLLEVHVPLSSQFKVKS